MSRTRALTAAAITAGTIAALLSLPSAQATVSTDVVVSEVYGGGGNSGATLKNDFIELRNTGTTPVSLASWSVQYISAAPGATTTWQVTNLSGTIAPGATYLVGEGAGAGGTADLPTPDATGVINMSGTSGTVALVTSQTALTCETAADCAADPGIKDLVGYGTAVIHEGTADAPATGNTASVARSASGTDTDQNGADFTAGDPTPGGSSSGGGTPEPGPLRVHDIQGAGWVSPRRASGSWTPAPRT